RVVGEQGVLRAARQPLQPDEQQDRQAEECRDQLQESPDDESQHLRRLSPVVGTMNTKPSRGAGRSSWVVSVRPEGAATRGTTGSGGGPFGATPWWGGPVRASSGLRRGSYFQEPSAESSCVSGLTWGRSTSEAKTIEGGELERGRPGRASMSISFSSWYPAMRSSSSGLVLTSAIRSNNSWSSSPKASLCVENQVPKKL